MEIGNMQDFREQQMSKVEKRKKEEEKIKKGIYQMQAMIDAQSMETFTKEQEKAKRRAPENKPADKKPENMSQESKKTDAQTEMEKMLSVGSKFVNMNAKII